jgi:hypothetical protein
MRPLSSTAENVKAGRRGLGVTGVTVELGTSVGTGVAVRVATDVGVGVGVGTGMRVAADMKSGLLRVAGITVRGMRVGAGVRGEVGAGMEVGLGDGVGVAANRGAQATTEASRRKVIKSPGRLSGDLLLHHGIMGNQPLLPRLD